MGNSSVDAPRLVQSLGLFSSTALVIGSMVGSGIFIVDADIARGTNSPALFLGAWVVTAVLTMTAALSYGELAAMMPKAGGQYVYLRESLGPLWGFLYGWTLFLVIQTGTIAAVAVAFGKFLGVFFPGVTTTHWLWHIAHVPALQVGPMVLGNMEIGVNTANLTGIVVIFFLAVVNIFGVKLGALIQNVSRRPKRCRWRRWFCWPSSWGATQRLGRLILARAGASFGRMPTGVRCIRCRWALAARPCWSTSW
jgi:APA family basic amino acid/polyamine antiporter